MNVNSGGPHLLLFERDSQLTALLTSEFQLAGYECHAARTAVEVFDAIARYPIRLVLVNLAQAAAGRREFWVALDAQRRGRGVQVFTFRCMNLAGYGPDDPDDRARTVLADMEVDGMLGVMHLVDAVRSRLPGSTTGSIARIPATPAAPRQAGTREAASVGARALADAPQGGAIHMSSLSEAKDPISPAQSPLTPAASMTGQVTSPLPMIANNGTSPQSAPSTSPNSALPPLPPSPPEPTPPPSSFTDKIRAVIYPSSRNFSPLPTEQERVGEHVGGPAQLAPQAGFTQNQPSPHSSRDETGLEQLSRMLREQPPPPQQNAHAELPAHPLPAQQETSLSHQQAQPSGVQKILSEEQAAQRPADTPPISALSLRPSPIQDITIEREASGLAALGTNRQNVPQEVEPAGAIQLLALAPTSVTAPLSSSTQVSPPEPPTLSKPPTTSAPASTPVVIPGSTPVPSPSEKVSPLSTTASTPSTSKHEAVEQDSDEPHSSFIEDTPSNGIATVGPDVSRPAPVYRSEKSTLARSMVEQVQASVQSVMRQNETGTSASTDETLLNIVQSFPPMPAPSQQPQQSLPPVLTGRATRSLGSVLLEGHLVPQHRLEVAQHIQRMLRGVDMNYQLGEILLMFKLLTPDQLLAASLVSYGLISTIQISALGRIRQELHAIGLEYDLESLLVLFRILSPDQLREVRASWSG